MCDDNGRIPSARVAAGFLQDAMGSTTSSRESVGRAAVRGDSEVAASRRRRRPRLLRCPSFWFRSISLRGARRPRIIMRRRGSGPGFVFLRSPAEPVQRARASADPSWRTRKASTRTPSPCTTLSSGSPARPRRVGALDRRTRHISVADQSRGRRPRSRRESRVE